MRGQANFQHRHPFWRITRFVLTTVVGMLGMLSLSGFFGAYAYLLNLASHFRVQYALALLGCTILLWSVGRRKAALLALGFAVINGIEVLPIYQKPKANTSPKGTKLSLLQLNVLSENNRFDLVGDEIERLDPDIVVMEEVTAEVYDSLATVRAKYPYVAETLHRTNLGVLVMSRWPLTETELIDFDDKRLPSLVCELKIQDSPLTLIATHPLSPRNRKKYQLRNKQLYAIAEAFNQRRSPLMMVGDLNITSFSPIFQKFLEEIKLSDSRQGFGIQPTWPSHLWKIARIAIDHCLLSQEITATHREVGNYVGSDHLPVYLELVLSSDH